MDDQPQRLDKGDLQLSRKILGLVLRQPVLLQEDRKDRRKDR